MVPHIEQAAAHAYTVQRQRERRICQNAVNTFRVGFKKGASIIDVVAE
jgi:hypothetical protein